MDSYDSNLILPVIFLSIFSSKALTASSLFFNIASSYNDESFFKFFLI